MNPVPTAIEIGYDEDQKQLFFLKQDDQLYPRGYIKPVGNALSKEPEEELSFYELLVKDDIYTRVFLGGMSILGAYVLYKMIGKR